MVVNIFLCNDLASKANSSHIHSNYVTSSQVVSIVNSNIQNGGISMSSGNPFKSITYYNLAANTQDTLDEVTITGSGIVTFLKWYSGSKITIDNGFKNQSSFNSDTIIFNSSLKIDCTSVNAGANFIVGLFN